MNSHNRSARAKFCSQSIFQHLVGEAIFILLPGTPGTSFCEQILYCALVRTAQFQGALDGLPQTRRAVLLSFLSVTVRNGAILAGEKGPVVRLRYEPGLMSPGA